MLCTWYVIMDLMKLSTDGNDSSRNAEKFRFNLESRWSSRSSWGYQSDKIMIREIMLLLQYKALRCLSSNISVMELTSGVTGTI